MQAMKNLKEIIHARPAFRTEQKRSDINTNIFKCRILDIVSDALKLFEVILCTRYLIQGHRKAFETRLI